MSDADLVNLSAAGDEEAFLILYRRHQGGVFRFAWHMSGKREIAEEVTQDVFIALLRGLRRYAAQRAPLEAYLLGVARNHVRRYLAKEAFANADVANLESSARPPGENEEEQQLAALRAAILALPPRYREVIVLCDLQDCDYRQAAEQLGCALGTVRSRLHRARAILQAKLVRRERCSV